MSLDCVVTALSGGGSEEIESVEELQESIQAVRGVLQVHELHLWRLTPVSHPAPPPPHPSPAAPRRSASLKCADEHSLLCGGQRAIVCTMHVIVQEQSGAEVMKIVDDIKLLLHK